MSDNIHRHSVPTKTEGSSSKEVPLEELFNNGRFKRPFGWKHILLALYIPTIGLPLFFFRLSLFFLATSILVLFPRSFDPLTQRLVRFALGFFTVYHNKHHLTSIPTASDPPRVIVCNHITDFDPYPIWFLLPHFHTLVAAHIGQLPVVGTTYRKLDTIFVDPVNKERVREQVKDALAKSKYPVLVYPEGGLTNGTKGLMLYHKFVFGLGERVLPIAMRLRDPWPINVDYLGSSWAKNFFWFLMVPFHVFELTFYPPEKIREGETDAEFAARVQSLTADALKISATSHSYTSKKELAKKKMSSKI